MQRIIAWGDVSIANIEYDRKFRTWKSIRYKDAPVLVTVSFESEKSIEKLEGMDRPAS